MSERDYSRKDPRIQRDKPKPYDDPEPPKRMGNPYDKPPTPKPKTGRDIMTINPKDMERKKKNEPFTKAWDDLIKFGDCPICHGDPMRCPESDKPASACSRRRNAMKHSRGSVARRRGSAMFPRE